MHLDHPTSATHLSGQCEIGDGVESCERSLLSLVQLSKTVSAQQFTPEWKCMHSLTSMKCVIVITRLEICIELVLGHHFYFQLSRLLCLL